MIGDVFLNWVYGFLSWIIGLFPASTGFSSDVFTAFETIGGYVGIFSPIIPYATLAITVPVIYSTEIAIFGFKTTKWIISHLPFVGGRG